MNEEQLLQENFLLKQEIKKYEIIISNYKELLKIYEHGTDRILSTYKKYENDINNINEDDLLNKIVKSIKNKILGDKK